MKNESQIIHAVGTNALTDNHLHVRAREIAATLADPDRKHLRFNEIVAVARSHYGPAPEEGIDELVRACCRKSPDYIAAKPWWRVLRDQYAWMVDESSATYTASPEAPHD